MPIPKKDDAFQRRSAEDLVYEALCDWIIYGEMMPGEKLLGTELVAHFNVSRTPVCEALQMLETRKLIKVTPGRAAIVTGVDKNDVEKYYRPPMEIQGPAVRLVAPRSTEVQLTRMEEVQMGLEEACGADQAEKTIHCDNKFHKMILRAMDNECTMEFSHILLLHVQQIKYHYFRKDILRKASAEYHRDILKVLYDQDADLAAKLMYSYWLYIMKRCLREVEVEGVQQNRNGEKDKVKQMG